MANGSAPSLFESLRGKRTSDIDLPNTSGRKDPRLLTTADRVGEGVEMFKRVVRRAKAGRATRR